MRTPSRRASFLLAVVAGHGPLAAEVTTIGAAADTSLFGELLFGDILNFGGHTELPAGGLGRMSAPAPGEDPGKTRALYKFDVAAHLPAGATIESACVRLTTSTHVPDGGGRTSDFALSRVLVDWGEGTGTALDDPGGRNAVDGEATWNNRFHPDMPWSVPGGAFGTDFAPEQSAVAEGVTASQFATITYTFDFNATGIADLQGMLDGTFPNHGWVLYSLDENLTKTARRWFSRESATDAPELEITWSFPIVVPVITAVSHDPGTDEVCLTIDGLAGYRYELQSSATLADPWQPGEAKEPAMDGVLTFKVTRGGIREFFRVEASLLP